MIILNRRRDLSGMTIYQLLKGRNLPAFVISSIHMRNDHEKVTTRSNHPKPLFQRFNRIEEMFNDMGSHDEIEATILKRQVIVPGNNIHFEGFTAQIDLLLFFWPIQLVSPVHVTGVKTKLVVGASANFDPVKTVEVLMSQSRFRKSKHTPAREAHNKFRSNSQNTRNL